jgi:hypothetical protein
MLKERFDPLYSKSIVELSNAAHADFVWSKRKPYAIIGGVAAAIIAIIVLANLWRGNGKHKSDVKV